jgi:hypothetical protein
MKYDLNNLNELDLSLEEIYNEICRVTMVKAYTKTNEIATEAIPIKNFDWKNPEHLYVLAIARALSGVVGVQVAIDTPWYRRWWYNRKIKVEGSKLLPYKDDYDLHAIDPDELLDDIRDWATEFSENSVEFDFSDIYYEFYA